MGLPCLRWRPAGREGRTVSIAESEPNVGFYGICRRPHSTVRPRQKARLLQRLNVGVNATILAAKRTSERRDRWLGMSVQMTQQAIALAGQYISERFPAFEGNCAFAQFCSTLEIGRA